MALPLIFIMVLFVSLIDATTYDSNFICMDSMDGITFWGVPTGLDVKVINFTLTSDSISIIQEVDLPDTLVCKQLIIFDSERVGVRTLSTYVCLNEGNIIYYYVPTLLQIKKAYTSSMYVLLSPGILGETNYDWSFGNQFCSQVNNIDNITCFGVNFDTPIKVAFGGYYMSGSGYMMAEVTIFNEVAYYAVPVGVYYFDGYFEIKDLLIDQSGIYFIATGANAANGIISLMKIDQTTQTRELLSVLNTSYSGQMILKKRDNFLYLALSTFVFKHDLSAVHGGWETIIASSYGYNAKDMFIAGDKLVALFGNSSNSGYFIVSDIQSTPIEDEVSSMPKIQLKNYPNPFNPTTTISFNVPEAGNVELGIYNVKGQLVKNLFTGQKSAGINNVVWDGTDNSYKKVTSGIYLYKMKTGSYSATRKMILLK